MCDKSTVIYRILHCIVYVEHAFHIHGFTVAIWCSGKANVTLWQHQQDYSDLDT